MGRLLKAIQLVERKQYLGNLFEELEQEHIKLHRIIEEKQSKGEMALDEVRQAMSISVRLQKLYEQQADLSDDILDLLD